MRESKNVYKRMKKEKTQGVKDSFDSRTRSHPLHKDD